MLQEMLELQEELHWLEMPPIFVGGAALHCYLDDFARSQLRTTKDIDLILFQITSSIQWMDFERQLRQMKWSPDMNGPMCRYSSPKGKMVDFLFPSSEVMGFSNQWYAKVVENPLSYNIHGKHLLIAQPALYLATKIEAFLSRGQAEPFDSQDLEDIVALMDGCSELVTSFQEQDQELREWIRSHLEDIQSQSWFETLCIGNLPRGGDERTREQRFLARWKRLTD
jgi:hypothetical protein